MADQRRTPGSQTSLREANRERVVDAVKKHGGLTQVELAGATGLSPATVSNIVKELAEQGLLHTSASTRSGRRAQYVTLSHTQGLVAGVHFGRRHLRIALSDASGTIVTEHEMPLAKDHRADNEIRRVGLLLSDMLDTVSAPWDELLAVGVAVSAPLDASTGTISRPGLLRGWEGVQIAQSMERALQAQVYVDNSSNLAALAELRAGALRGVRDGFYIELGDDGIGAGLVMDGRIYRGAHGTAGEFGHIAVGGASAVCRCGNIGCLEAIAGGQAIVASLADRTPSPKLTDVLLGAMSGDDACIRAIAESGALVGEAASNQTAMFDPSRIVIGGFVVRVGEIVLGPIRQVIDRVHAYRTSPPPEVVAGQLGERAGLLGAIAHAFDEVNVLATRRPVSRDRSATLEPDALDVG